MSRDYELHITNYVLRHFRHLMTEVEQVAADAFVFPVLCTGHEGSQVAFRGDVNQEMAKQALEALKDGVPAFRRRTRERILRLHKEEVYANACPHCGRLPASTTATMCIWCSHSWRDAPRTQPFYE